MNLAITERLDNFSEKIPWVEKIYQAHKDYIPTKKEALEILEKENLDLQDIAKLLNVEDNEILLLIANKAQKITKTYFGNVIFLYAPLYISNYCQSECPYCGFSSKAILPRKKLSYKQIEEELKILKEMGINSVIILTGEDINNSSFEYIKEACKIATEYMSEVSIEVYPLSMEEYAELSKVGVVGIAMYQETYQRSVYEKLHLKGLKKNFEYRLTSVERALKGGFHEACIGPLLGLGDPKLDVLTTIAHGEYLLWKYPKAEISISFPRLRNAGVSFSSFYTVSDKEFIKYILVTRLYLHRIGIVLSTRESPKIRDGLIGMVVTKMSAGSKTYVGGYSNPHQKEYGQFDIEDGRSVEELVKVIKSKNLMPEFTNWVGGLANYV